MNIQNIIFDLGNVIINIQPELTIKAFSEFVPEKEATIRQEVLKSPFFQDYETGKIKDEQFRDSIRQKYNPELTDQQIDEAWNALLLDIPNERLEVLANLKDYRIFLLSNTNQIHVDFIVEQMIDEKQPSLESLFEKVYYSQNMDLRKPNPAIYQKVLDDNQLKAEETVFLDDNLDNVRSASTLGIHIIHIQPGNNSMMDFFTQNNSGTYQLKL